MITYYYKNSRTAKLTILDDYKPGAWINVESPTSADIERLAHQYKLDIGRMMDVMDIDEIPRLEFIDDATYLYVRYAFEN